MIYINGLKGMTMTNKLTALYMILYFIFILISLNIIIGTSLLIFIDSYILIMDIILSGIIIYSVYKLYHHWDAVDDTK